MLPFIVDGIFGGAAYALAALGIVLTYKTTGIFNFAFGGVAMTCAFVFWQLRDQWGVSQWFSLPIVLLVVAPLVGLVLEALFRPLTEAATEVQVVVSLGVLAFLLAVVPIIFGSGPIAGPRTLQDYPLPTIFPHFSLHIGSVHISGDNLGTLITAIVLAVGLGLLLRRTRFGTATRAVIDNRELAGLIAVNSGTVGKVAWITSTGFAAIAGILLSTENYLVYYVLPALVISAAFAPAVAGRLTSLPLAFAGAMVLGVVQNVLNDFSNSGFISRLESSLPDVILLVLLVVYGNQLKEVRSSLRPTVRGRATSSRPYTLPAGIGTAVAAAVILPLAFSAPIQRDFAQAMAFAVVALTLVVLTGWTGQISIAQMSFAGVGALTVAHIAGNRPGMFFPALLLGALISLPLGIIIGLPSLRLSGLFLALATFAFALIMDTLVFGDPSLSGGQTGLNMGAASIGPLSFKSDTAQFFLCLVVLTLACVGAYKLRRGPLGRRLNMLRDSPAAASTLGANITLTKLAVFAGGAVVASIGGSLLAITHGTVDPNLYNYSQSLELLLLVVVGGRTLVSGAVVAGLLYLVNNLPNIPVSVHTYEPLLIALTVVAIAKGAEGLPQNIAEQTRYCLAVLYRLPRREMTQVVPALANGSRAVPALAAAGGPAVANAAPTIIEPPAPTPARRPVRAGAGPRSQDPTTELPVVAPPEARTPARETARPARKKAERA